MSIYCGALYLFVEAMQSIYGTIKNNIRNYCMTTLLHDHFLCYKRDFPSANSIIVQGPQPILIDTGFITDKDRTEQFLKEAGVQPHKLYCVVNTHAHSDHVGGNHWLQSTFDIPIAAHVWSASAINRRAHEVCSAEWLDQPVLAYHVNNILHEADEISTGAVRLTVLHTPAHTLDHIVLYDRDSQTLIAGDVLQQGDIGWLNPFHEGTSTLDRAIEVLECLAILPLRAVFGGHGSIMTNPDELIRESLRRYSSWLHHPEKMAWHAMKRIFAYALLIRNGIKETFVREYLQNTLWLKDYSTHVFRTDIKNLAEEVVKEMLRSGAAEWRIQSDHPQERVLCATVRYNACEDAELSRMFAPAVLAPFLPKHWYDQSKRSQ